jgi:beta-lactamase superfamily II metal-dependent hydrolase
MKELEAYFISPSHKDYKGLNNHSVVLYLKYDNIGMLFMGDAEEEVEHEILHNYPALSVDILKAGHHGSRTSSSEAFIHSISPSVAVIMCGVGNRYGHPYQPTLDTFVRNGTQILRTDLNGTIVIQTDGETFSVSTEKGDLASQPEPEPESLQYIGNINSKVFHLPTCSSLPAERNRIFFSSKEEAIEAGYRPCGRCKP